MDTFLSEKRQGDTKSIMKLLDYINILGVMYSILGFLYLTYELFGKNKKFKQALRVITPIFLGILVLTPIGILEFAIYAGPLLSGAIEYGPLPPGGLLLFRRRLRR